MSTPTFEPRDPPTRRGPYELRRRPDPPAGLGPPDVRPRAPCSSTSAPTPSGATSASPTPRPIDGRAALVEWVSYPSGRPNPQFLKQLAEAGRRRRRPAGRVPLPLRRALGRRRAGRDRRRARPGVQRARGLRGRRRPRRPPRALRLARRRPALAAGVSAARVPGPGDWDDRRAPGDRPAPRHPRRARRAGPHRSSRRRPRRCSSRRATSTTSAARGRGRVRRRGRPVPVLPLRQPDGVDVRGAPAPARGRRGGLRHRDRACPRCSPRSPRWSSPARASSPRGRCSGRPS